MIFHWLNFTHNTLYVVLKAINSKVVKSFLGYAGEIRLGSCVPKNCALFATSYPIPALEYVGHIMKFASTPDVCESKKTEIYHD